MKSKLLLCVAVILTTLLSFNTKAKTVTCLIKGTIVNRNSKAIILMKATEDPRTFLYVRIPIVGNTFEYKLITTEQEAYMLIFEDELEKSSFKPIIFFPDTSEVRLTLYAKAEAEEKNEVKGGLLNRSYQYYLAKLAHDFNAEYMVARQKQKDAIANKTYYTAAYDSLVLLTRNASGKNMNNLSAQMANLQKTGADLTPTGKMIWQEESGIINKAFEFKYAYIRQHASPVSYYMVFDDVAYHGDDEHIRALATAEYKQLAGVMPGHPYTKKLGYIINALNIRPGQSFIDFDAPDLDGKIYKLSSLIKGKLILLDLWASWCGPCITKTREILPVYNEFKDKGFQVVGIAREFKDLENLKIALNREKHPWLTLVDLDGKYMVWDRYGLSYSGGGMILMDPKGIILAVNPTADVLKGILKTTLK